MKNEKRPNGYATSDINIAAAMLTTEGVSFHSIEGDGQEKVFILAGDPEVLADYKHKWFHGVPFGDLKKFAAERKALLTLLPRKG